MSSNPDSDQVRTAAQVRRDFLDFFVERGHREVPSSAVFPLDNPTLLFTNAGMNQFSDVFLGTGSREYARAVDTQKCLRVSGKHNDLEEVGRDTYHHTFFEMLGNWSFGDYFKEEAIRWAWELLTEVWKLPKDRLWVTVFEGDPEQGVPADDEAARLWIEAGVAPERVLRFGKKDNFWEMGETGPCGPCTEIHIDRGGPDTDRADGANRELGVNAGNERFIELWNLVFIQFNRLDDGSLKELPAKHVDTGMGFERILSVLQGKSSNYDTDLWEPIFAAIEGVTGKSYAKGSEETKVAFRVVADHLRAVTCAISDGALPSNTGRGYVLRRLIRRAARFGRQVLAVEEPFLFRVAESVARVLGVAFPEIPGRLEHVQLVLREEESSFGRTLGRGLVEYRKLADRVREAGTLPGGEAYELYATYGFPQDLVEQMAEEDGLDLDREGWDAAELAHQAASRVEGSFKQLLSGEESEGIAATESTYHAEGDESVRASARVLAFYPARTEGTPDRLVLSKSPFYPEAGGQCGDRGRIAGDGFTFAVEDARKAGSIVVHLGHARGAIERGAKVTAEVDAAARGATRRNHTATHLMHEALRQVLGEHVAQQGSYVGPDRLRFDFTHPKGVSAEELEEVERRVGGEVLRNAAVNTTVEELEAAKARGATALFGEKYEDLVRVVEVPGFSTELCGGTHVAATGEIGAFTILSERAISAGVRRIEALTGEAAQEEARRERRILREAAGLLKAQPEELAARIGALQEKLKEATKQQKKKAGGDVAAVFERVKRELVDAGGVLVGAADAPELDGKGIEELAVRIGSLGDSVAAVLVGREGERVPFQVLCTGAAQERGVKAGVLAKAFGQRLKGGGGGRPDRAQGQGTDAEAVPAALDWAKTELARRDD